MRDGFSRSARILDLNTNHPSSLGHNKNGDRVVDQVTVISSHPSTPHTQNCTKRRKLVVFHLVCFGTSGTQTPKTKNIATANPCHAHTGQAGHRSMRLRCAWMMFRCCSKATESKANKSSPVTVTSKPKRERDLAHGAETSGRVSTQIRDVYSHNESST